MPWKRSLICTECLEHLIDSTNLDEVDALMRHLDLPFDPNLWLQLYPMNVNHTLTAYFKLLNEGAYDAPTWAAESERWKEIREKGTIDNEISTFTSDEVARLQGVWGSTYNAEELRFLENFYREICDTQNVSTPINRHLARDLCEVELRIKNGLRTGIDVKKDMDARDNIIREAGFTAINAKNAADFDSIGEVMMYYVKKGWHPTWHTEPQDVVDFTMKNVQSYLTRLVMGEGNMAEQVADKQASIEIAEQIESEGIDTFNYSDFSEEDIQYEGEDDLAGELNG